MRINDAIVGAVLAVFAVAVWVRSGTFPELPGQAYGPALFPRVIAAALLVCALILSVRGFRNWRSVAPVSLGAWSKRPRGIVEFCLVPLSLVAYILLSEPLGFIPVALGLLLLLFLYNGVSVRWALVLAAVTVLVVHTAFYQLLRVPLPWGVLQAIAW